MPPRRSSPTTARGDASPADRRSNPVLRELLDEMLVHVRDLANRARELTPGELEYAQERLEWLADEIWESVLRLRDRGETGKR
jgi:hypothetical protein